MISYYRLKQQLLKALSLTKDRTKLVMVQRLVNKPGIKTFIQTFYVRPDQIRATDHVIAGHHNLPDTHPQKQPQVKFTKEIKQQTREFFSKFSSTTEAYISLRKMGITWEHTDSAGRNLLRAKQALNHSIQSGFVIPTDQHVTTAAPSNIQQQSNSDHVVVPADATPAQRNLAELINKMTDIPTLQKCAVMGIVPEDDVAKDFVVNTLMEKLANVIKYGKISYASGDVHHISAAVAQHFYEDMISLGFDFPDPSQRDKNNLDLVLENAIAASDHPDSGNISRSVKEAMGWIPFNMDNLVNPHKYLKLTSSSQLSTNPTILMQQLNQDYFINPSKDAQQDGFVQILQRIKQENAGDDEVTKEVDRMINNYVELIHQADPERNFQGKSNSFDHVTTWSNVIKLYDQAWYDNYRRKSVDSDSPAGKVVTLVNQLFGAETTFEEKKFLGDSYIAPVVHINPSRANKIIVANLIMAAAFNRGASAVNHNKDFDFYVHNIDDGVTPESQTKLTSQLKSVPLYSAQYIDTINQHYQTYPSDLKKDDLKKMVLWREPTAINSSPLKTVLYNTLVALTSRTNNPLTIDPNKFLNVTKPIQQTKNLSLKDARQLLFNQAKLSLATESMETSDKMRQDILQNKFDYKSGDKDRLGHSYWSKLYDGIYDGRQRYALFNSRFFKVNNSIWEERINEEIQQLKQQYPDHPEYYEVNQGFHGTSYWSAANIIGRDGEFAIGQYITNGAMFGTGIYLGDRLGKSITYVGNDSYSMLSESDLDEDDADGIVMLSDYIQGANIVQGGTKQWWKNIPEEATCVLAGPSNSPVKAAEIVIRNNAQLCPRYLVDVSGRSIPIEISDEPDVDYGEDFEGNIQQDDEGNFGWENEDGEFEILYTADGKSVNMK